MLLDTITLTTQNSLDKTPNSPSLVLSQSCLSAPRMKSELDYTSTKNGISKPPPPRCDDESSLTLALV